MLDEDIDSSSFPLVHKIPKSMFATLPRSRNQLEILKNFPTIPPAPETKTVAGSQVEDELNVRVTEQAPFFYFAEPKSDCCKKAVGSAFNDPGFNIPVTEEPFCESLNDGNKGKRAHFNNSLSNNYFCPSNSDAAQQIHYKKSFRMFQILILHFLLVQGPIFFRIRYFQSFQECQRVILLIFQKYLSIISASKPPSTMCGLPF